MLLDIFVLRNNYYHYPTEPTSNIDVVEIDQPAIGGHIAQTLHDSNIRTFGLYVFIEKLYVGYMYRGSMHIYM